MSITRDDAKQILEQVKANSARLDACDTPHEFVDMRVHNVPGHRYRCSKCGGEVAGNCVRWYRLGMKHAGRTAS
jgi:predicted SprT family Zn-dependent metalloprotease